jgi:uncharacterized protein YkwD
MIVGKKRFVEKAGGDMPRITTKTAGRFAITALAGALLLAACQSNSVGSHGSTGVSGAGLAYMKNARASAALSALSPDSTLERAAIRQAGYMAAAGKMDHTTGWRKDFATRMAEDGVAAPAAENLAHGRMEMGRVFEMWMASTGHRNNMLDPRFQKYGLAHATAADGRRYWALVLGK